MSKTKKMIVIIISILVAILLAVVIANKYFVKSYTTASAGEYKAAITEVNSVAGAEMTVGSSATGVHMQDTITITISAKCQTGLGGLDAVLDWDENKIEFTNKSDFPLSDIDDVTGKFKLSVLYNGDEQEAVLATLKFKVLDTAIVGETLNISLSEIELIDNNIDSIGINDVAVTLNVVDHTFTNYTSNNDATCTKDGTKTAKCDKCSATKTITDVGSKLEHNYKKTGEIAPTCTESGVATYKCTSCQSTTTQKEGNPLGHSFTNYTSNNDATCTKDGTKTAKCDRCSVTETIADVGSAKGHNYENWKCTDCGKDAPRITITSEKYEISSEGYITKISNKTTLKDFKESLSITNATEVKVLDKNNKEVASEDIIATGMTLILKSEIETKTLKLVVVGDATGDGIADFKDIVAINRHRLNQKLLEGEYLTAGEVTGDGIVDFKDIVKINRFRLNKITELF